jgi:MFS family permease
MRLNPPRLATFNALQNSHFRWYWLGMLASSSTIQMGRVGQGWLVYEITGSALALGWVAASWSISNSVLSPWAGVLSDRLEKRTLLLWTRGLMMLSSLTIAGLIALDVVQVWHLAAYSLFRGVLFAVLMPAQYAYLAELVDRRTLFNALSLNSVGMGLAGIFAASLAGILIDAIGVEAVYLGISLLYLVVFVTVLKLPRTGATGAASTSVWSDMVAGVQHIRARQVLVPLLAIVFIRGALAMPYRTLMPKYAQDVMRLDASGLGVLVAAPGVGSLISSLILASAGRFRGKGKLLLGSALVLGTAIALFANSEVIVVVLILLGIVGAAGNVCMVTNRLLLQVNCDAPYLGRVMSAYMMMFGLTQLITIPVGAFADSFGAPPVLTALGGLMVVVIVGVWVTQPRIRKLA